jgi:hypothetical protein
MQCGPLHAGSVLEDGITAVQATALQELFLEKCPILGCYEEYVYIVGWNDAGLFFKCYAETMGKIKSFSFGKVF